MYRAPTRKERENGPPRKASPTKAPGLRPATTKMGRWQALDCRAPTLPGHNRFGRTELQGIMGVWLNV